MSDHTSTIRETCKTCGESHVSRVYGITNSVNYAVVVDTCIHCATRKEERQKALEAVQRMSGRGTA